DLAARCGAGQGVCRSHRGHRRRRAGVRRPARAARHRGARSDLSFGRRPHRPGTHLRRRGRVMQRDDPAPAAFDRERLLSPCPRPGARSVALAIALLVIYVWGLSGTDVRLIELLNGIPAVADFVSRLFPPAWKVEPVTLGPSGMVVELPEVLFAIIETIQMA